MLYTILHCTILHRIRLCCNNLRVAECQEAEARKDMELRVLWSTVELEHTAFMHWESEYEETLGELVELQDDIYAENEADIESEMEAEMRWRQEQEILAERRMAALWEEQVEEESRRLHS